MTDFPMKLQLRIDWGDLDAFGHVNNLAIMKYVQAARVQYMDTIGLMQSQTEMKIGPILASISCQFRKPLFYPGEVTVYSKINWIKNTSFQIQHAVYNGANELAAEALDVIVLYDFRQNIKVTISDELREKIKKVEDGQMNTFHSSDI